MTDDPLERRLEHFERFASADSAADSLEAQLARRERRVFEDALEQTRKVLAALERRGEHRGAEMARRSVYRLELAVLDARMRAVGLPVPSAVEQRCGLRERAAVPLQ
jgi:hypothetical protein